MNTEQKHGVAFLARQQRANGSFMGHASRSITPFVAERQHQTIFFTALIATCLRNVPNTEDIQRRAVSFLVAQKGAHGSWNYWQRSSKISQLYPYPDDLDDTACALLALWHTEPNLLDGEAQAQLAQHLINTEVKPGGPYKTWLVTDTITHAWSDVDPVVNANIGALLNTQDVALPGLNTYIDEFITRQKLQSPYYVGIVPTLYFLARWYRGSELHSLKKLVLRELRQPTVSDLHRAMLISAARELTLDNSLITTNMERLRVACQSGHWAAEALYIDPVIDGSQYYAGSEALTTAFALEALAEDVTPQTNTQMNPNEEDTTITLAITSSTSLPASLQRPYKQAVQRIALARSYRQIGDIAGITAAAYNQPLHPHIVASCNAGSLNGWIAYTIYDDFLDDEGRPEQLGVANYALRQAVASFSAALPNNHEFQGFVDKTFNTIDAANTWEIIHARHPVSQPLSRIVLPKYRDYRQLAERSSGHMLASCGILYALGFTAKDKELQAMQRFFRHFLIARQLNDDAHDWQADLTQGHLSSVVTLLLSNKQAPRTGLISEHVSDLRQLFWQTTITEVAQLIEDHIQAAERALSQTNILHPEEFLGWLEPLQQAATMAAQQSQEAQKFITTYEAVSQT